MADNSIHPTAVVGDGAELGSGNVIGPYAVISSGTRIGDNNWIGAHSVIGSPPEHRAHRHPHGSGLQRDHNDEGCVIGDSTIIREFAVIQSGRLSATRISDNCFLMAHSYVAHDGRLEQAVTISASVTLAGHVTVGAGTNIGMNASIRQGTTVGIGAMIGMGAVVIDNVPAFVTVIGVPARSTGINRIGLERIGFGPTEIQAVAELVGSDELRVDAASEHQLRLFEDRYRLAILTRN